MPVRLTAAALLGLLLLAAVRPARAAGDPWTGPDKALHFGLSTALGAGSYGLGVALWDAPDDRWKAALFSLGITLGAGGAKELADLAGLGHPSWRDFTWDVIGAVVGLGLAFTFDVALRGWPTGDGAGAGVALGGRF
jgi:putative lipoprotein